MCACEFKNRYCRFIIVARRRHVRNPETSRPGVSGLKKKRKKKRSEAPLSHAAPRPASRRRRDHNISDYPNNERGLLALSHRKENLHAGFTRASERPANNFAIVLTLKYQKCRITHNIHRRSRGETKSEKHQQHLKALERFLSFQADEITRMYFIFRAFQQI